MRVMVKVTFIGILVGLVSVPLISPEPLAAIPVTIKLSLVQLYTVPDTLPVSTIVVIAVPEQLVCEAGVATAFGLGFTVTFWLTLSLQPLSLVTTSLTVNVPAVAYTCEGLVAVDDVASPKVQL